MSVPTTTFFNIERLRRYDGPGWFLGGGFVAGLLFFLVWAGSRPDDGRGALRARGNGVVGMAAPDGAGGGVLDDITGELRAGSARGIERNDDLFFNEPEPQGEGEPAPVEGTLAPDPRFDPAYGQDADAMAVGEDVGMPPDVEGALTDSLLGPPPEAVQMPMPEAAPPGPALMSWFVEVEVAPGQVQMLQLNAESPEHALAILRDFRGNPRVLRGPSPEPLP